MRLHYALLLTDFYLRAPLQAVVGGEMALIQQFLDVVWTWRDLPSTVLKLGVQHTVHKRTIKDAVQSISKLGWLEISFGVSSPRY